MCLDAKTTSSIDVSVTDAKEGAPIMRESSKFGLTGFTQALADEGKEHSIRAIVLYPGAMDTNWGAFSPEERQQSESNEAPATQVLRPERVASFISWFVASPPEFVLTEGIVLPIEEGLP